MIALSRRILDDREEGLVGCAAAVGRVEIDAQVRRDRGRLLFSSVKPAVGINHGLGPGLPIRLVNGERTEGFRKHFAQFP